MNCGAIPPELVESELFGHLKGSFTGAMHDKQGLFQAAEGGTLLLDEVADLPLATQVKLLRVLQEKAVRPVGSETEVSVDVRLISATHKRLNQEVAAGRFRDDLFTVSKSSISKSQHSGSVKKTSLTLHSTCFKRWQRITVMR